MTAEIRVVKQALFLLGEKGITALNDESVIGDITSAFYPDARLYVLQDLKPPFARAREALAGNVLPRPVGVYEIQYPLPIRSCLITSVGSELTPVTSDWTVEGQRLLVMEEAEWVTYIRRDEEIDAFMDGPFIQSLVQYLGHLLAYAMTGDKNRAGDLLDFYERRVAESHAIYALQGSSQQFVNDELILVR